MQQNVSSCFPAGSEGRLIASCVLLAAMVVFLSGCEFFRDRIVRNSARQQQGVGTDYVSVERGRYRRHNHRFVCLVVIRDKNHASYDEKNDVWSGSEVESVRRIAKRLSLEVDFVEVNLHSVSAALRNGKGDVAIGRFTETEVQNMHLRAVALHPLESKTKSTDNKAEIQGGAKTAQTPQSQIQPKYCLMVRNADTEWAALLAE